MSKWANWKRQITNNGKRSMFSALFTSSWNSLGSFLGTYDATDARNKAMRGVIARPVSAADLTTSIPYIRNLCRNFERNNPTVRAATEGLVANVVGCGIKLEPETGDDEVDRKIREQWDEYIKTCYIDKMGLNQGLQLAFREVVVAGESLWRLVVDGSRSNDDLIPLCIQPLEPEWLGDAGQSVVGNSDGYVGGITLDQYARPISYHLTSPSGKTEAIPAKYIIHAFERRRSLQLRGEPWFAPILTTLRQEKDLVQAELEAAKNTAGFAAAITSNGGVPLDLDEKGDNVRNIELGTVVDLAPGEDIKLLSHTRPSQQIAPFRQMLRGDMAAALRIGQRWLDRDVSRANYSSMRADMLDSERLLAPVREWFGHQTVGKLYQAVLPYLAVKAGVKLPKNGYRLVTEGQPYVDPLKDVQAAAYAVAFGLSNYNQEMGARGSEHRKVWEQLAREKKELEDMGIVLQSPAGMPFGGDADIEAMMGDPGKTGDQPRNPDGSFGGGAPGHKPKPKPI